LTPFYDSYRVLSKIYSEGAHLKQALSDVPLGDARALTVRTVYGVLENDGYLSLCIRTFAAKAPKQSIRIVLKIALYHLIYLKKPRYAVTDCAVSLCKELGKGGIAGFVNAFFRAFDAEKVVLPAGEEGESIRYRFPLFALRRVKAQYGARAERILQAESHGVCVRFVRGEERYAGLPHEETPFKNVWIFPRFTRDEGFFAGDYTFQSVGSIAICSVIEGCETFLDACAAPGGKSVLLSSRCDKITACERYPHRAELIGAYCSRMKVENVTATVGDASVFSSAWEGAFDGVLCDVPCSGLGTVRENPDIALRRTEKELEEILPVQRAILSNCARYVRNGGALYYSTCSLLKEENDDAVEAFLLQNGEFSAEEAYSPLAHEKMRYGLQFLPDTAYGAGFYVAKLRKRKNG